MAAYSPQGPLQWAATLGGTSDDAAWGVAADARGGVYIAGNTSSRDFPLTPGAAQPFPKNSSHGSYAFAARLVPPGGGPHAAGLAAQPSPGTPHGVVWPRGGTVGDGR